VILPFSNLVSFFIPRLRLGMKRKPRLKKKMSPVQKYYFWGLFSRKRLADEAIAYHPSVIGYRLSV